MMKLSAQYFEIEKLANFNLQNENEYKNKGLQFESQSDMFLSVFEGL